MKPKTLFEKIWDKHLIASIDADTNLLFIDMHLVHEVTSPQAFDSLRISGRKVKYPELTLATVDHGVPTSNRALGIKDPLSKKQIDALEDNCKEFGVTIYGVNDPRQGIVHVIGPEQGITQPGMTIVCGDSHTATHGAFGALAFGIGTSEVEHVLATQTLAMNKPKTMKVEVVGEMNETITPKDVILGIIREIGTGGGAGHVIEYSGDAIKKMSMENRMTICNMSIEGGARAGMIAPDEITYKYLKNKNFAPKNEDWDKALNEWKELYSDDDAEFDKTIKINVNDLKPSISWGTNPSQVIFIDEVIPSPDSFQSEADKEAAERALDLLCKRSLNRTAFGKTLSELGGNYDVIADCRIEIDMCRLLTLKAAYMMDTVGNKIAKSEIAQIKVAVPNMALRVIDKAIQIHGGAGVSQDTPLARLYAGMRTLRLADGPDEVHRRTVARLELGKHQAEEAKAEEAPAAEKKE